MKPLLGDLISFWSLMSDSSLQVCWPCHENPLARQCRDTYGQSQVCVLFFAEEVGLVEETMDLLPTRRLAISSIK